MTDMGTGIKGFAGRVKANGHERVGNAKTFAHTWRSTGFFTALRGALDGQSKANRDLFPGVFRGKQ